ncbi:MAG: hypothetical protein ABFD69_16460 [Candidatus Sumerlaeia bacterium]
MKQHPSIFQYVFVPAICLVLLLGRAAAAAPAHPHLFYTASEVASLQSRISDPFYQHIYEEIISDCRFDFGPGQPVPDTSRVKNARAIMSHGTLLLVDPLGKAIHTNYQSNVRFFDYFNATLNMSGWSNFFNNNCLDSSFLLIALCYGYDIHYAKFTSTQRADIVNKLAARADYIISADFCCIPEQVGTDIGYKWDYQVLKNQNLIPLGALGMIAYTLEGEVSETRRQVWLAKIDEILGTWDKMVSHDGVSHEGYSYHEYMIRSMFPMLYARSRRTGVNQFTKYAYFKNHVLYSIYSWVPGGDRSFIQSVPFADCDTGPPSPVPTNLALIARMLKDDGNKLDHLANWMQYKPAGGVPNCGFYRVEPPQIIWADSSISRKSPAEIELPLFRYFPERGHFVWRSSWDNMATYFTMMCGPTIGGHQHPEMGNFVIHKGGAPFIASHGYSRSRRCEDYNLMLINGLGQWGDRDDDGGGTTQPMPSSKWASIYRVVADDDYFDVLCNLTPIQRDTTITSYTREFVQVQGVFFVADKTRVKTGSPAATYQSILNAYSTNHPPLRLSSYNSLDIDSSPTMNPWTGTGRTHKITPRKSGPYTGSMTVQDLSRQTWTPTIAKSVVNNDSDDWVQRGYRLTLNTSGNSADLFVACYFPLDGNRTVSMWPTWSVGNGFMIKSGSTVRALGLWPDNGAVTNSYGLTMTGAMGGLDLVAPSYWGRDIKTLQYNGRTYVSSTNPVSLYCRLSETGARMRLTSDKSISLSVYIPNRVKTVKFNNSTTTAWSWSNGMLKLTSSAKTSQVLVDITTYPKNTAEAWALYE